MKFSYVNIPSGVADIFNDLTLSSNILYAIR